MSWVYSFDDRALKELKKLNPEARRAIVSFLDERVAGMADPRRFGKGLKANLSGLWRYRVGDYRILCQIRDGELLVLVIPVGHRKDVYECICQSGCGFGLADNRARRQRDAGGDPRIALYCLVAAMR